MCFCFFFFSFFFHRDLFDGYSVRTIQAFFFSLLLFTLFFMIVV